MKNARSPYLPARLSSICLAATILCSAMVGETLAAGRAHRYSDITITELDIPTASSSHGYAAYRFTVSNKSKDKPHTVRLKMPRHSYDQQVTASQTVTVGPGASTTISLFQPPLHMSGDNIEVAIDSRTSKQGIECSPVRHGSSDYWRDETSVCILTSKSMARNFQDAIAPLVSGLSSDSEIHVENSGLAMSYWPDNWLAYSRYDAVVISNDNLRAMPTASQEAVMRYVSCGGTLIIAGPLNPPPAWTDRRYIASGLAHYSVGFGTCVIAPRNLIGVTRNQWGQMHETWAAQAQRLESTHSVTSANETFPIVDDLSVPTGGMLAVMLGFVILAGPVNMILLSKFRRRTLMFITVPVISFITCVSVFAYAFFAEGWDGRSRTAAVTILDQRTHRAATIGWTAFYSPMTPDGLHFSRETEITPQWSTGDHGIPFETTQRGNLHTDWTSEQHLQGEWVTARAPVHMAIRKAETRRERLSVTVEPGGSITVVNGLGATITSLYLADATGKIHSAENIAPGAKAALTRNPPHVKTAAQTYIPARSVMSAIITAPPQTPGCTARRLISSLRPNCYVADLDGAPFVEKALDSAEQTNSRSVVYGILGDSSGS